MQLAGSLLAAFYLCTPAVFVPPQSDTLTVHINLAFDRSITSKEIKAAAQAEAAAIWKHYGVDLRFGDRDTVAPVSLDVVVERDAPLVNRMSPVLGRTNVASAPEAQAQAQIRISFDAIDWLLEHQHGANPLIHDYVLAAALGRVLAHEIGHVLLGAPAFHDAEGLMRTTFVPDDLGRPERSRFRLSERSVARLRARIASLTEARASDGCGRPDQ